MTTPEGSSIRTTAFDAVLRANGAQMVDWEGWFWAAHFGDPVFEHHAVRTGVGVWDESPLQKCEVTGPGATAAVNHMFTADLSSARVGQVKYSPFCNEDGKMVGDGTAFKLSETKWWVMATLAADVRHLRSVAAGFADIEFREITYSLPHLQLQGPRSRSLLQSLADSDLPDLGFFTIHPMPVTIAGVDCWLSRTGYSGESGFELFLRPPDAEALWTRLVGAGATPYGVTAIETLRIESALLLCGVDFVSGQTSPFEVGLDRFVDIDVSDCLGRDALLEARAQASRRFVSLLFDGNEVPANGVTISTMDGHPVGTATSHCMSPSLRRGVGLAIVDQTIAAVGTRVVVGDSGLLATILLGPVYDPQRQRPRLSS